MASEDLFFGVAVNLSEDDRVVDLGGDDLPALPVQTRDDTDAGWGEHASSNDDRLREERPPHW